MNSVSLLVALVTTLILPSGQKLVVVNESAKPNAVAQQRAEIINDMAFNEICEHQKTLCDSHKNYLSIVHVLSSSCFVELSHVESSPTARPFFTYAELRCDTQKSLRIETLR